MSLKEGGGPVVRRGYLKKLKTNKKKYFVLRAETAESSARLDYYDSDKKFNAGQPPKRSIPLKTCFNINKKLDTKHKHVIALYTKDDCFCIVLECEEDLDAWLKALLSLQHGEDVADGETPRPTFEHVWQVQILSRGVGTNFVIRKKRNINGEEEIIDDDGHYRFCLTDKTLSVVKDLDVEPVATFPLNCVRSCGCLKNYFYLELGRSSTIGAGELWLETEDNNIANNIQTTVYHAMNSNSKKKDIQAHGNEVEELGPKHRYRSSSATESSKPINRRPGSKPISLTQGFGCPRERCDSMPSRTRTASETSHTMNMWQQKPYFNAHRPQSLYGKDISHSPPTGSPISPHSQSTDSAGSSMTSIIDDGEGWTDVDGPSIGRYHSITPDEAIAEENIDDCPNSPILMQGNSPMLPNNYVPMGPPTHSSDDGYVDMSPRGGRHNTTSPAASLSSVTSATPSTDMRFAEYPLEKVSSYLIPGDYDNTAERPARAYSVGSRPETMKYRTHNDSTSSARKMEVRDRAFSVGSKTKKIHSRLLPPHSGSGSNHGGNHGHKSSSAPLLLNSRFLGSHSSITDGGGRMGDLMEMDFSRPPHQSSQSSHNSGYVDMKPGLNLSKTSVNDGYVDMQPSPLTSTSPSPYVDMRCGSSPSKTSLLPPDSQQQQASDYMDMDPKRNKLPSISPLANYPPHTSYMDMNFNTSNSNNNNSNSNSNNKTQLHFTENYSISPTKSSLGGGGSGYSTTGSPSTNEDYLDMDFSSAAASGRSKSKTPTNEGYVEMSFNGGKRSHQHQQQQQHPHQHQRQSSLDENCGDYTNMSIGGHQSTNNRGGGGSGGSKKGSSMRSLPIQIQSSTLNHEQNKGSSASPSSPMYSTMFYPRKYSTGTPPGHHQNQNQNKYHLPLNSSGNSYSSLPRRQQRTRKDSKDSSSSTVTTPSSSSTIFPFSLNSPSSPIKPFNEAISASPEKSRIGTSSTLSSTSDYVNYAPAPQQARAPIAKIEEGDYALMKSSSEEDEQESEQDYAMMKPLKFLQNQHKIQKLTLTQHGDQKKSNNQIVGAGIGIEDEEGDYAFMQPGGQITVVPSSLTIHQGLINPDKCFRPIADSSSTSTSTSNYYEMLSSNVNSNALKCKSSSRPNSVNSGECCGVTRVGFELKRPSSVSSGVNSRPSSTSSELCSSSSTLVGSRPESVNSDRIRPSTTTATTNQNQEGLHYASLDLAAPTSSTSTSNSTTSEGSEGLKSPRTQKDNDTKNSASSTTSNPNTNTNVNLNQASYTYADISFSTTPTASANQQQQSTTTQKNVINKIK